MDNVCNHFTVSFPKGHRSSLDKCRCGVVPIQIETGRYENAYGENRLCLFCNDNAIENVEHVILNCCAYNDIRPFLFTSARSIHLNLDNITDDDKLWVLIVPKPATKYLIKEDC